MAKVPVPESSVFLQQLERVRVELRDRIARAHKLLREREKVLMLELQQLEDEYRGQAISEQIQELCRLRGQSISTVQRNDNQEFLCQAVSRLDERMRELYAFIETARYKMRRVVLVWDEELDRRLSDLGCLVHDQDKLGVPLITSGKHYPHTSLSPGDFSRPYAVAIDAKTNNVFVCDSRNNRVQIYNDHLQYISDFGYRMSKPFGMCISEQMVYVTQTEDCSLTVHSTEGRFLHSIGRQGKGELEFSFPMGVVVSAEHNRIYVCEWRNNRIQCLDLNLEFHSFITGVVRPQDIKLSAQEIVVLSGEQPCVTFYDYSHQVVRQVDILANRRPVTSSGFFCLDRECNILVTDISAHSVYLFSNAGRLVSKFGKRGDGSGDLISPRGICVDYKDRIIVVSENPNFCIQMF